MKNISAIIWDLDKTLYPFDEDFCVASKKALAKMILELGIDMSLKEAVLYTETGYPMKTISKLNKDFNINIDKAFFCYYNNLDNDFIKNSVPFLEEIRKADVTFAVLSHANRDWTERALQKMGLSDYIDNNNIITIESLTSGGKEKSTEPYKKILERLDIPAHKAIMVEDKDKNLKYAQQLGIKTILVTNGDKNVKANYADKTYKTAHEFLKEFNKKAKNNNRPQNIPPPKIGR